MRTLSREELLIRSKAILLGSVEVEGILNGRKKSIRMIVDGPYRVDTSYGTPITVRDVLLRNDSNQITGPTPMPDSKYREGDVLAVKEVWAKTDGGYSYKADISGQNGSNCVVDLTGCRWNPPYLIPKEAIRILLRVKDVRVERLQDITIEGIEREGFYCEPPYTKEHFAYEAGMRIHFIEMWNSSFRQDNLKKFSWNENPYVWVVEFEMIDAAD